MKQVFGSLKAHSEDLPSCWRASFQKLYAFPTESLIGWLTQKHIEGLSEYLQGLSLVTAEVQVPLKTLDG